MVLEAGESKIKKPLSDVDLLAGSVHRGWLKGKRECTREAMELKTDYIIGPLSS